MNNIFLPNRYKDQNYLQYIKSNNEFLTYQLVLGNDLPVRVGYDERFGKDFISFIDPSGGPFLCVNSFYDLGKNKLGLVNIYTKDSRYFLVFKWEH